MYRKSSLYLSYLTRKGRDNEQSSLNRQTGPGPQTKTANTHAGTTIVKFSLATDESYTGQDGNKVERAEQHRVVTFGKQADFCANYLSKGRLVLVEGSIQTRKWQDQEGRDRCISEIKAQRIQALDRKSQQKPVVDGWGKNMDGVNCPMKSNTPYSEHTLLGSQMDDDLRGIVQRETHLMHLFETNLECVF